MKLLSWNVNGIRAAEKSGFLKWFTKENADFVCLQEIKAFPSQLSGSLKYPSGYEAYWHPAEKPGYSGLVTYTKKTPLKVHEGIGAPEFDREGRVLTLEFEKFFLCNTYFPNSQRDHARLDYKLKFCKKFLAYCESLRTKKKNLILCGDFNIAHHEVDLRNPKSNHTTAGFLPEERSWLDTFIDAGYIDTFRHFEKGPGHYTWWSYRPHVREKNIGWRIDYFFTTEEMKKTLASALIQPHVFGSDHCPVSLEVEWI